MLGAEEAPDVGVAVGEDSAAVEVLEAHHDAGDPFLAVSLLRHVFLKLVDDVIESVDGVVSLRLADSPTEHDGLEAAGDAG